MNDETKDPVAPSPAENAAASAKNDAPDAGAAEAKAPEPMPVIFNTAGATPPVSPPPPGGPMAALRSVGVLIAMLGIGYVILTWLGFVRPIGGGARVAGPTDMLAQSEREAHEADQRSSAAQHKPPPVPAYAAPTITVSAGMIGDRRAFPDVPVPAGSGSAKAGGKKGTPDEMSMIDGARAALAKGEAAKALILLDAHDHDFAQGLYNPDAKVLRIEALARTGEDTRAKELAEGFLADFPHSPLAPRVRALLDAINRKIAGAH